VDIEQLRIKGKELGIRQAMNMKEETLLKRIAEAEVQEPKKDAMEAAIEDSSREEEKTLSVDLQIDDSSKSFLATIDFKYEWLDSIANRYNFNRFQYAPKFKAFRCYQDHNQLDWISVNDLAMLNGKQEITKIMLKHQPHTNKSKIIIKLPWRR